jgi:hypothetical protein
LARLRYNDSFFIDSRIGGLPFQMVLLLIAYSFSFLPTVPSQGPTLSIEWLKLYPQGVLLLCQLLGNITSVTPQGEIVRVGRGRVGRPPVALLMLLLLALTQQGSGVLVVQGGPSFRG